MKYLRRFVWYIATRLLMICALVSVMVVVFYYAMNTTNIYIVLKDGMAKRAQVIMTMEKDPSELTKFFQTSYLAADQAVQMTISGDSPYENFNMVGMDHRLTMEWMWSWPWDDTARAVITETVPKIDARPKASAAGNENAPSWQGVKYRVVLAKENGQWKIRSLTAMEYVDN
ncbi:MAG: hypothetical protein GX786_07235 [Clostridiales bacterium]|nr:hypothetical protein [Clostridiales bacterium]